MTLFVVGAGGLGPRSAGCRDSARLAVAAFVDERVAGTVVRDLPVVDPDEVGSSAEYLIGIADPRVRSRLAVSLDARGAVARTLVHPTAVVAPETSFGGSLIMGTAHVSSSVTAGRHCQVQYGATVGHDTVMGACVTVLPGANVSGSVVLGDHATVGSGAVVLQGRTVGAGAFVGAGAVVTKDVAEGVVVVGNPAREMLR